MERKEHVTRHVISDGMRRRVHELRGLRTVGYGKGTERSEVQ